MAYGQVLLQMLALGELLAGEPLVKVVDEAENCEVKEHEIFWSLWSSLRSLKH